MIELKQKRLNGGARNEAYLHISNDVDYIWYIDSDDWVKDKYVLEKINKSLYDQPDVLFVGMDVYKNGEEQNIFAPRYDDLYQALNGWSGSCGKVIKKEIATKQECLYNEGTLKEDKNQHFKICLNINSFKCLPDGVYVWNRTNTKSVTTNRNTPLWKTSTIRHLADTIELYMIYKERDPKIDKILEDRAKMCWQEVLDKGDRQF